MGVEGIKYEGNMFKTENMNRITTLHYQRGSSRFTEALLQLITLKNKYNK